MGYPNLEFGRAGPNGLDAQPLADWVSARINEVGISNVASAVGVSTDRVYRVATARFKRVNVDTAEKFLNAFGENVYSIYPDY